MRIHLSDISSSEGKCIQQSVPFEMDRISFQAGTYPVLAKKPVELCITNTGDRILELTGHGQITVSIPCDRCLEDVKQEFDLNFTKHVDLNVSDADLGEGLDESNFISGYHLDVDKMLYNEILVGWPTKVLCSEDCKGIWSVCGQNLNEGTCDCEDTGLDPRMSVVRDLFKNFKEV